MGGRGARQSCWGGRGLLLGWGPHPTPPSSAPKCRGCGWPECITAHVATPGHSWSCDQFWDSGYLQLVCQASKWSYHTFSPIPGQKKTPKYTQNSPPESQKSQNPPSQCLESFPGPHWWEKRMTPTGKWDNKVHLNAELGS